MTFRSAILAVAVVFGLATAAQAEELKVERLGVYVSAKDLQQSSAFYAELFGKAPRVRTPSFIGFDLTGSLFAVVSSQVYGDLLGQGGRVIPYIRVADITATFARVRAVAPASIRGEIVEEGPLKLFKISDPEGNVVEFYSVASAAP